MVLAGVYFARGELHNVDHTEMDSTDFGGIVVDQADDAVGSTASDIDLLGQFSLHTGSVPIVALGIFDGDVSTDSHRLQGVQASFSLPLAACVLEQSSSLLVVALEDHIGDQLLEGRVGLHEASRAKGLMISV
jgi:hypothetical protein